MELPELYGAEVGALSKDLDALLERLECLLASRGDRLSKDELGAELPSFGDVELLGDIGVDLGMDHSSATGNAYESGWENSRAGCSAEETLRGPPPIVQSR